MVSKALISRCLEEAGHMLFSKKPTEPQPETSFLPWQREYAIGIHRFDEEHQKLVALVNHLHVTLVVRREVEVADKVFEQLIRETRAHFTHEEDALTEAGYSEWEAHFAEHSKLLEEVVDLHRKFKMGTLSAMLLLNFLKTWLIRHTQEVDRRYVPWLKKQGLS